MFLVWLIRCSFVRLGMPCVFSHKVRLDVPQTRPISRFEGTSLQGSFRTIISYRGRVLGGVCLRRRPYISCYFLFVLVMCYHFLHCPMICCVSKRPECHLYLVIFLKQSFAKARGIRNQDTTIRNIKES